MPSYRLRVEVGLLHPGARPQDVLPAAVAATELTAFVESREIDVSGGAAWVQLRVTVPDSGAQEEDDDARAALAAMRTGIERHAATGRGYILRRLPKGVWVPIPL